MMSYPTYQNEKQLGWIVEAIGIGIAVGTLVYNWIEAENAPDTWSAWDDGTKEAFITDFLKEAFKQDQIPPRDFLWRALSDSRVSVDSWDTWWNDNKSWVEPRVKQWEKATGKGFYDIPSKTKTASFTPLLVVGLLLGTGLFMVTRAIKMRKSFKQNKKINVKSKV